MIRRLEVELGIDQSSESGSNSDSDSDGETASVLECRIRGAITGVDRMASWTLETTVLHWSRAFVAKD